jgi:KDO2-lipid IV(A) lauroyltransferase
MVSTLRAGGLIAVLLDQRLSDGVDATLFGQPAKSPSGAAMMALRLNLSMHPTEIERAGPARYRITVHPAMDLPQEGDLESRTQQVVEACNRQLEAWITARPHEWLWMHRRWEKATYRDLGLMDRE